MLLDTYKVDYSSDEKKTSNKKPSDKVLKLQEEANRRSQERRKKQEWKQIPFDDLDILATQNTDE